MNIVCNLVFVLFTAKSPSHQEGVVLNWHSAEMVLLGGFEPLW